MTRTNSIPCAVPTVSFMMVPSVRAWEFSYYCNRGSTENFFEEGKNRDNSASVSSKSRTVNANRLQPHALVYNIFDCFRRLVLPEHMRKNLIDTVRLKPFEITVKVIHTGRYVKFKLCSCPYKGEVYGTLRNIWALAMQLE